MVRADNRISISNSEHLFLDKVDLLVVRRVFEQVGDLPPDKLLIAPGGMGMTTGNFCRQLICVTILTGPGIESVPVRINTSFADCM